MRFINWSMEHTDLSLPLANILFEVSFCYKCSWLNPIYGGKITLLDPDIYIFMKVFRIMKSSVFSKFKVAVNWMLWC